MKVWLFLLTVLWLTSTVSAVNVSVSADGENLTLGDTVVLHLEIDTKEPIGGQFVLYREVEPKKYSLVKIFYDAPNCATCGGGIPLSRPLSGNYHYVTTSEGNYMAEAAFGGAADRVYFTVLKETTTTTTTTTTSTTTTTTTTSTTTTSMTTTTKPGPEPQDQGSMYPVLVVSLFLAVVMSVVFIRLWKTR